MDSYSGHSPFNLHMVSARFNFVPTNLRVKNQHMTNLLGITFSRENHNRLTVFKALRQSKRCVYLLFTSKFPLWWCRFHLKHTALPSLVS